MVADQIVYYDEPDVRFLDLRPDGVDCIPLFGFSSVKFVQKNPELHYHPGCMEFCLCIKGNLAFETPERKYPFLPGYIFVSSPSQLHHLSSNPCGMKLYRLLFKIPKPRQRILGLDLRGSEWLARSLTHLPQRVFASIPGVRDAFDRLMDIYDNVRRSSPSRRVKIQSAALDLLLALVDAARQKPTKAPGKIDRIAERIRKNPHADYPVRALAKECDLALSTFSSAFKSATGLPLHAFLINCRIEEAKRLLHSQRTITAIGQELGFYSAQHFAKTFKRTVGLNPKEYRDALLQRGGEGT